ncbi:MAG: hypothetical protein L3K18_07710 [Thermoplasmata archaeon]|nr:hypothetical protein [Thermoplasmata archaeon]MCI4357009.1 hypothetical protein [Thermoplasmata archaeon]
MSLRWRRAVAAVSVVTVACGIVLILHRVTLFHDVQNQSATWRTPCPAGYGPCHVTPPWAGEYERSLAEIRIGVLVLSAGLSALVVAIASTVRDRWRASRIPSSIQGQPD